MNTGTRALADKRREARLQARKERLQVRRERRAQAKQRQAALQRVEEGKRAALERLSWIADQAVARLDRDNGAGWTAQGELVRVCRRRGPHLGFWCLIHGRHTVALMQIPGSVGADSGRRREALYLGANGRIYRQGRTKVYRAELNKRDWPSEILALAEKIARL